MSGYVGVIHALLFWNVASGRGVDPRLGTTLWVGFMSWSPEGDSNVCFVEVALAGGSSLDFFKHPCSQGKCGGLLGVAFCYPVAALGEQTP